MYEALVLNEAGQRLAKRDGAVTLADRRALGDTPDAVLNRLLASLGLPEVRSVSELGSLIDGFDPSTLPTEPWVMQADEL